MNSPALPVTRKSWFVPAALVATLCLAVVDVHSQVAPVAPGTPAKVASLAEPKDGPPTYLRDVLPIFMGKCSRCHNSQSRFVYNWLDYKTAYKDRGELKLRLWDSWKGHYFKEAMPIENSPEYFAITPAERKVIKDWVQAGALRGVPPPPGSPKTKAQKIELGRAFFVSICAACHQPTGQGIPQMFPPLASSDYLNADKNRAIQTLLNGRQGEVVVNGMKYNNSMPSFPLSDDDIAYVLTFVYNSFGNSGLEVSPDEVKALRGQPDSAAAGASTGPKQPEKPSQFE